MRSLKKIGSKPIKAIAIASIYFTLQILPAAANIRNFSARAVVAIDPPMLPDGVAIAGFTISGTGPKQVMIRGLGPTLTNFSVSGALGNPTLMLFDESGTPIASNNDWKDAQQAAIQATGLAPSFDTESAILITLQPGNYTAILSAAASLPFGGIALVEVYDVTALPDLGNVSTRGIVATVNAVLISGFIISPDFVNNQVLVRGLGPTLAQFGVGVAILPLADPVVTLVDGNGNALRSNNNWKDTDQAPIEATGLAPPNDLEAAIIAALLPGHYTVILSSNAGDVGIGLVEVYKLRSSNPP